jgi:ubiquinone biosynthesis protein Coq4
MKYMQQDSNQTLHEGLTELYGSMDDLLDPSQLDERAQQLFELHDAAHVVFGCDTSLHDEVLIDTWTLFGSDIGLLQYAKYLELPEAREVVMDIGLWRTTVTLFRMLPEVFRTIRRARSMRSKWPWQDHAEFLNRPLSEVRRELGIDLGMTKAKG